MEAIYSLHLKLLTSPAFDGRTHPHLVVTGNGTCNRKRCGFNYHSPILLVSSCQAHHTLLFEHRERIYNCLNIATKWCASGSVPQAVCLRECASGSVPQAVCLRQCSSCFLEAT